jgi:hypothetical protein
MPLPLVKLGSSVNLEAHVVEAGARRIERLTAVGVMLLEGG